MSRDIPLKRMNRPFCSHSAAFDEGKLNGEGCIAGLLYDPLSNNMLLATTRFLAKSADFHLPSKTVWEAQRLGLVKKKTRPYYQYGRATRESLAEQKSALI